jgi:hypothetical protein
MRRVLFVLAALSAMAFASGSNFLLDRPVVAGSTDDLLQYDDGSAYWLTWGGLYRGTWFNLDDFLPGGMGAANNLQYWFYHHASYPWDTASFYSELYNGDAAAPVTQLNQTSCLATHYTPITATYATPIVTESDFWGLINTEMSAGGWPSVLGDNSAGSVSHSMFSDDFIVWEPWIISGSYSNDYLIRCTFTFGLESTTWGAIKGLYN